MTHPADPAPGDDPLGERDDLIAGFQVEDRALRGRALHAGETLNLILSAHDYPAPIARLLGEAVMIAALVGDAMKFQGRLIVQANGAPGAPLRFVVAEFVAGEGVRGFAQMDRAAVETALAGEAGETGLVKTLLGEGTFAMTIDQGPDMDQYQGLAPLEGDSLAESAEHYFRQSEQTPTRLRLAVGEIWDGEGVKTWRGGGAMLQAVAGDEARGDTDEDWEHGLALFDTVTDAELLDPDLSLGRLLFRLFNKDGVRILPGNPVQRRCSCEPGRLARIIASFPESDVAEMVEDGRIVMTCEYCNKDFAFTPEEVEAARAG